MGTYTVKKGENIYDIALRLYGGIEGLFDLMVLNVDAISETGMSLKDTLVPGQKIEYTDGFSVKSDIANWLERNKVKVRNGEHLYFHYDMEKYAVAYAKQYNAALIAKALELWPSIKSYNDGIRIMDDIAAFFDYINSHAVWSHDVSERDMDSILDGSFRVEDLLSVPDAVGKPKMVVNQVGKSSTFAYKLQESHMMIVDWGDASAPGIHVNSTRRTSVEHCYEDTGSHIIKIYGDPAFSFLDLRGIGGTYYPLTKIIVSGDFHSDLKKSTIINHLITKS